MRLHKLFTVTFLLLVVSAAAAQEPTAPFEIGSWFTDTAALAAIVVAAVAFLKTNVLKSLTGVATIIASLVIGAALGAVGAALGYVDGGLTAGLLFGVTAGFLASGGWDAIGGLLGKREAST